MYVIVEDSSLYKKCIVPKELSLKVGVKVIITRNLYNGLMNGISGFVLDMEDDVINVQIDGHSDFPKKLHHRIFPIARYKYLLRNDNNKVYASRSQFPLKLGYAVTVDKSQGRTLENVIIDAADFWRPGQLAVAIGRARTKSGIQIVNYRKRVAHLKHGEKVNKFCKQRGIPMRCDTSCCRQIVQDHQDEEVFVPLFRNLMDDDDDDFVPNANTRSNTAMRHNFPWDIKSFTHEMCPESSTPFQIQKRAALVKLRDMPQFKVFLQKQYNIVLNFYNDYKVAKKAKQSRATLLTRHVHSYCTSKTFIESSRTGFNVKESSRLLNHVATDIVMTILRKIAQDEEKSMREESFRNHMHSDVCIGEVDNNLRCVIRYISGAAINSVSKYYSRILKQTRHHSQRKENVYYALRVICSLRSPQGTVECESKYKESAEHVVSKQGNKQALTHVADNVLQFFEQLYSCSVRYINKEMLKEMGDACLTKCLEDILCNQPLVSSWYALFEQMPEICKSEALNQKDNTNNEEVDLFDYAISDYQHVVLYELLEKIVTYFTRVRFSDSRAQLVNDNRVKKQAHWAALASKPISNGEKSCTKKTYPCGVCNEECREDFDSFEDQSVQCTKCKSWLHFPCAGLTGEEDMFEEGHEDDDWFCRSCTQQEITTNWFNEDEDNLLLQSSQKASSKQSANKSQVQRKQRKRKLNTENYDNVNCNDLEDKHENVKTSSGRTVKQRKFYDI